MDVFVAEGLTCQLCQTQLLCSRKKLLFAPGKAANAGGVATSGLEMSQNSLLELDSEEVDQKLKKSCYSFFMCEVRF
jgi:glutamate dehydrogenase (NADP+)